MPAVRPVVGLGHRQPGEDDGHDDGQIDDGEDGVDAHRSLRAAGDEDGERQHDAECDDIRVLAQPLDLDVPDVSESRITDGAAEDGVEGAAPRPRHGRDAEPVFQDDVPADDEGA